MATLMFWNKQQNSSNQSSEMKTGKKNWIHSPDLLVNAHVAFQVKFLGKCPVDQPKGIDVVKDAIRRLQILQEMKKAEHGSNLKIQKVEITVSIDGVTVQELRTQKILHQFPLYQISYCADEKASKKFLAFIAKSSENLNTNSSSSPVSSKNGSDSVVPSISQEKHECFVFISSKYASDITLTIGQAFDLAYRRYKNDTGKTTELGMLQSKNKELEKAVTAYKNRIKDIVEIVPKSELESFMSRHGLKDILEVPIDYDLNNSNHSNGKKTPDLGIDVSAGHDDQLLIETSDSMKRLPPLPARNLQNQFNSTMEALKSNGSSSKIDGMLLNSDSDSDFDPRADEIETSNGNKVSNDLFELVETPKQSNQTIFAATNFHINSNFVNNMNNLNNNMSNNIHYETSAPLLAPPPKASQRRSVPAPLTNANNNANQDLFGSTPFHATPIAFDNKNKGLSFGHDDFTLESLDPLRK